MNGLKVACVQMRSGMDVARNMADAEGLIRKAADAGAELIATPEMTSLLDRTPGAVLAKSAAEAGDPALVAGRALSRELGVWLLLGSLPVRVSADRVANRSFLLTPQGDIAARYDKIHMFDVQLSGAEVYRESATFEPGATSVVVQTPKARLGMTICYDVRFPHLFRDLAKAGAELITVPAAFTRVTGEAHWHVLLRARAIETGCFVVAPAQGGRHEDGRETYGHSLVIDPWGAVLAEADTADPCVITAVLDLSQAADARRRIPALTHDRPYGP
jgi:deaminated glutathione amidase